MPNIVAIVGRPNVGKSTLFNRLISQKKAIMDDESGVTRDRHYGYTEWTGKHFVVIDTGGYVKNSDDIFEEAIRDQVELAIEEANVILFVVDVDAGLTDLDKEFAQVLRRTEKPVYIVANKSDTPLHGHGSAEFYALGIDNIHSVSAANGSGTGDLLDDVITHFQEDGEEDPEENIPRIAILGRPNVGKSSMVNALLGKERSIVTDLAGTTRDSIDARYNMFDKEFILTDTAGIRKKKKVKEDIEFYSVLRSIRALEHADVCMIMIDATLGIESQDLNLVQLALKNKKGIVVLVNKWDLVEKDTHTAKEFEKAIKEKLAPNHFIPVLFISAIEKQRIFKSVEKAIDIYENYSNKISTSKLNEFLLPEIENYPPPAIKGKYIKIKYITQLPTHSPTFAFFCNHPQYIKAPYVRFLENKLRTHFNFEGVPVKLVFRKK